MSSNSLFPRDHTRNPVRSPEETIVANKPKIVIATISSISVKPPARARLMQVMELILQRRNRLISYVRYKAIRCDFAVLASISSIPFETQYDAYDRRGIVLGGCNKIGSLYS